MSYPKTIYLIRHAEETGDKNDPHLSAAGRQRANALVNLFGRDGRLAPVDFLIAADRSKHSNRSIETLQPLALATGLRLNTEFDDDEFKALAKRLLTGKKYVGATVLIAWHHSTISNLAKALGIKSGDLPSKSWPDSVYDWVWIISYDDQSRASIRQELQGV